MRTVSQAGDAGQLATGPLTACWTPNSSGAVHEGIAAIIAGRLHDRPTLAAALGVDSGDPAPLLLTAGYRRWGETLLDRLRGTFALLVWDLRNGRGIAAVDGMGAGALFVHNGGPRIVLATEIRDLLEVAARSPSPDPEAIVHWLIDGELAPGATLLAGVRRLRGGTVLALDERGLRERRAWRPDPRVPRIDAADAADALRAGVFAAVRRRIEGAQMPSVMLGGGLDSGTVAGVAAHLRKGAAVRTYSAVFPAYPTVDESGLIDAVTDDLKIHNGRIVFRGGSTLRASLDYLNRWQLPPVSPNLSFQLPMIRLAAEDGCTVMLDGQGGDELFGLSRYLLSDRLRIGRIRDARRLALALVGDEPGQEAAAKAALRVFGLRGLLPARSHRLLRFSRSSHYAPEWLREAAPRPSATSDPWRWKRAHGPRWWAYLADLLTGQRERTGAHDLLRHMYAMSGLEGSHPFLDDRDLVELVLRLPPQLAFDERFDRPLLRKAMAGITPDVVRLRREKSFFNELFVDSLTSHDWPTVLQLLGSDAELRAFIDLDRVHERLLQVPAERHNVRWAATVWRLALMECWLKTRVDRSYPLRLLAALPEADYSLVPDRSLR